MNKSYKVLVFNESRYGRMRSLTFSSRFIKFMITFTILLFLATIASLYGIIRLSSERTELTNYNIENQILATRLEGYKTQFDEISSKSEMLSDLSNRITGTLTVGLFAEIQQKYKVTAPAIGGKERELYTVYPIADTQPIREGYERLEEQMLAINLDLEKRQTTLAELLDIIEEQEFTFDSTPTIWPTKGWISSPFGYRRSPFTGRQVFHEGIDIAAPYGKSVWAAANGIVIYAGKKTGYGQLVTIDHGYGYVTRYAHNSRVMVKAGDNVKKGEEIAKIGSTGRSTGPHVHFELLVDGIPVNPMRFILK